MRIGSNVVSSVSLQATPAAANDALRRFAEGVEGEDDQGQRQPREEAIPPGTVEMGLAGAQHLAPGRSGRADAEAEEGESDLEQDGPGGDEGGLDQDGAEAVWQDGPHQDARRGGPDGASGHDVFL